jgi:hypothetical protein
MNHGGTMEEPHDDHDDQTKSQITDHQDSNSANLLLTILENTSWYSMLLD